MMIDTEFNLCFKLNMLKDFTYRPGIDVNYKCEPFQFILIKYKGVFNLFYHFNYDKFVLVIKGFMNMIGGYNISRTEFEHILETDFSDVLDNYNCVVPNRFCCTDPNKLPFIVCNTEEINDILFNNTIKTVHFGKHERLIIDLIDNSSFVYDFRKSRFINNSLYIV